MDFGNIFASNIRQLWSLILVLDSLPVKGKSMADVKENAMLGGVPARIRALDVNKNSILVDLLSAFQNLIYRGEIKSNNEEAINNATASGLYNHGAGLYGTGSGWHGILIVLNAGPYKLQIDIPMRSQNHAIFWRVIGGPWEKITSVTV